jgi:hypothetical protein
MAGRHGGVMTGAEDQASRLPQGVQTQLHDKPSRQGIT